jgi:N-methylhydantoinase B
MEFPAHERRDEVSAIDPITLECICEGLQAIVREMRAAVKSTAYSSVIYEMDDFSCGLFDAKPQLVAQGDDHPGHVVPLPWSVQCAMEDFAGDLHPGDIILLNDPYRGGTHLNDVTLVYPVFVEDELFIFPAVREHWTEGGHDPHVCQHAHPARTRGRLLGRHRRPEDGRTAYPGHGAEVRP